MELTNLEVVGEMIGRTLSMPYQQVGVALSMLAGGKEAWN
jgi:hypothetical protein